MDMENRTVESASESKEEVMVNLGLSHHQDKEQKSVSATQAEETIEESETSEPDEDIDDASDDEVTDDESLKDEASKKGKKQGGFQKKINKLTGRALTAEQERDYWKQEALKQSQVSPKTEETKAVTAQASQSKPSPESFESHSEYVEALTDWKIEERERKATEIKQQETAKSEAQAKAQTLQSKISEFAKVNEDYHDVLADVDDVPVQAGLINLIVESKNAPLLNYELAKNRVELERINALPPREAAIELLRFEARILSSSENNTETKEVKTTQAARPLKPVSSVSKAGVQTSPYEKEMSYSEFKEWSAKQKR